MLERNLPVEKLKINDLVATEKQYMTSEGCYMPVSCGLRVKRFNRKSISFEVLSGENFAADRIVRIPLVAIIGGRLGRDPEPPLFKRNNNILVEAMKPGGNRY